MPTSTQIPRVSALSAVRRRQAFTLLEVLLVVALIGLLSGVLVTGLTRMLNPPPDSPAQAFWRAARAARKHALENATQVRLSYNANDGAFEVIAEDGTALDPIQPPAGTRVEFLSGIVAPTLASNGVNGTVNRLFGSVLDATDAPTESVTFFSDGTSSLFRVRIHASMSGADTITSIIEVDPWTCSPMLGTSAGGATGG
jgi:prepilin-type N-terminal cleavage/methylation domain-containing protein